SYKIDDAFTITVTGGTDTLTDLRVANGAVEKASIEASSLSIDLGDGANTVTLAGIYRIGAAFRLTTGSGLDIVSDHR
ncbi:hypothetical protein RSW44_25620, partial [Escherichia coli]|nr:hypothetical protein [Escherichia coli]